MQKWRSAVAAAFLLVGLCGCGQQGAVSMGRGMAHAHRYYSAQSGGIRCPCREREGFRRICSILRRTRYDGDGAD